MKGKLLYVLMVSAVFITLLYGIDQWMQVNYILKSTVKISLLAGILMFYKFRLGGDVISSSIRNFRTGPNPRYPLFLGVALVVVIPLLFLRHLPSGQYQRLVYAGALCPYPLRPDGGWSPF